MVASLANFTSDAISNVRKYGKKLFTWSWNYVTHREYLVRHFLETFLRRGMILGRDFVSLRCTVLCRKVETNFYYVILYVWRLRDLPFLLREVKDHLTNSSFEKSSLFVLLESKLFRTKDSRRKEGYVKNVREKREDRYIWVLITEC